MSMNAHGNANNLPNPHKNTPRGCFGIGRRAERTRCFTPAPTPTVIGRRRDEGGKPTFHFRVLHEVTTPLAIFHKQFPADLEITSRSHAMSWYE